jgi:hypothetical protein
MGDGVLQSKYSRSLGANFSSLITDKFALNGRYKRSVDKPLSW